VDDGDGANIEESGLPEEEFDLLSQISLIVVSFTTRGPITFGFERADLHL